jgi:TniQ
MSVRKLRLTVPFHSDETPTSYLSRLAANNGVRARRFCSDFQFCLQDVVDGNETTLRMLAALGGIEPDRILANAFMKSGPLQWTYRGEILHRTTLRRARIALCPACALADIEATPQLAPEAAAYGRAAWLLDIIRVCPVHRIPLASADQARGTLLLHDFAQHAKHLIPRLAGLATAPPRDPSPFQTYVHRRLDGTGGAPLLDSMQLASVVRLCETAGSVALFPEADAKKLTEDQRRSAGSRGYQATAGGADVFRSFLTDLKGMVDRRARVDGPAAAFGKLHWLLSRTLDDPDFDAVREIMRDFVVKNFAIDSGQSVLGEPIEKRRLHSLHTLANEASVHPKVLRRHLRTAGLITDAQMDMSDHNVLFNADAGRAVAAPLAEALSLTEAMQHMNVPRTQMTVLVKHGFVRPRHPAAQSGGQDRYAATDLDAFLVKLGINSPSAYHHRKFRNIPATAKQCCRSAADVIRLILDGQLETKKATGSVGGYLSILVDPDQAAKALRGADNGGVPLREAARRIGTSDRVLDALVAYGHVAIFIALNPVNRCRQKLIASDEIERFQAKYVSLWVLSKQRGLHIAKLEAVGVETALDPKKIGASFYRVADLTKVGLLQAALRSTST